MTVAITPEARSLRGKPGLGMVGLLLAEIILGYEWFLSGLVKVVRGDFASGLPEEVLEKLPDIATWYGRFLRGVVIPNATFFGYAIEIAEILAGAVLIVGPSSGSSPGTVFRIGCVGPSSSSSLPRRSAEPSWPSIFTCSMPPAIPGSFRGKASTKPSTSTAFFRRCRSSSRGSASFSSGVSGGHQQAPEPIDESLAPDLVRENRHACQQ